MIGNVIDNRFCLFLFKIDVWLVLVLKFFYFFILLILFYLINWIIVNSEVFWAFVVFLLCLYHMIKYEEVIRMFDQNNFDFDSTVMGNNNVVDNDMNVDINMNQEKAGMGMNMNMNMNAGMGCPVQEGVQQKCIHKTIVHEVPHVCPIHTRIINHHVFKHTYRPQYTCSEENVVSNVQCGSCCQFR